MFSLILSLFLLSTLSAQENATENSENPENLTILEGSLEENYEGIRNRSFNFYLKTPFLFSQRRDVLLTQNWSESWSINGPFARAYYQGNQQLLRFLFQLRISQNGIFPLQPFLLELNEEFYQSNSTLIVILNEDEIKNGLPLFLSWELPKQLYLGESTLVGLTLNYASQVTDPLWLERTQFTGALVENVSYGSISENEIIAGVSSYEIPLSHWVITATELDKLRISAVQIRYQGVERSLPAQVIEVLEPDAELKTNNAFGKFKLSAELEPQQILPGGQSNLRLSVEGEGNLHYLRLVEPDFGELTAILFDEELKIEPSEHGYRGKKSILYRLKAQTTGNYTIRFPTFVFLDSSQTLQKQSLPALQLQVDNDSQPFFGRSLLPPKQLSLLYFNSLWLRGGWLFFLPLPLLFALFIVILRPFRSGVALSFTAIILYVLLVVLVSIWRSQTENHATIEKAQELFDRGEYASALTLYRQLTLEAAKHPGYKMNESIILYQMGDYLQSLRGIYETARFLPRQPLVLDAELELRKELRLAGKRKFSFMRKFFFVLLGMLLEYMLTVWLLLQLYRRRSVFLAAVFSSAMLVFCWGMWILLPLPRLALAADSVSLQRVAENFANQRQNLRRGELLTLLNYRQGYYQIRSEDNRLGWVNEDALLFIKE